MYVPPVSLPTLVAAVGFVVLGAVTSIGLASVTHWLAGTLLGAVFCAVAYVAAESHAATQRVPNGSGLTAQGAGFRDPEDDGEDEGRVRDVRYGPAGDDGSAWREP